jgi:predicted MFS family arabinose efflux permease
LKSPVFRVFWLAALFSNLGTWVHETGASWLMSELDASPWNVSLVRTAMAIPVFVLSLPAGVVADWIDRRKVLMITQLYLLTIASVMAALTYFRLMTPMLLLTMTLCMGLGMVIHVPTWQSIIPDLVPKGSIPAAVGLGSLSFNLARAIGPAVSGLLMSLLGAWISFAVNAISFLGIFLALLFWKPAEPQVVVDRRDGVFSAIVDGIRHVLERTEIRHVCIRLTLFVIPASALWGLMPLIARQRLGLQEAGYGAMLGLFGAGAVAGALALPVMRHKFGSDRLLAVAALTYGSVYLCLASNLDGWVRLLSMTLAGLSWMTTLTTLNTTAQVHLARSHRARGMAIYLMVFAASMAVGSAFWGRLASSFSLVQVLAIVAAVISVTAFAAWLFPIGNLPSPEQPPSSEQLPSPEQPPGSVGEKGEVVATG